MNTRKFLILAALALAGSAPAQIPDTLWTATAGGSLLDYGRSVQQTGDGGFIVAGITETFGAGQQDMYLVKIAANGDICWTRTYGDSGIDGAHGVDTTAGGYIVAGCFQTADNNQNMWVIRTDADGTPVCSLLYGGPALDYATHVQSTRDGHYVVSGKTVGTGYGGQDAFLMKLDGLLNVQWTLNMGGPEEDGAHWVEEDAQGDYILTGATRSGGAPDDLYLFKVSAQGDTIWTRSYGGDTTDIGDCVRPTSDGGYIVCGHTWSFGAGAYPDIYLIKTDSAGTVEWERAYGGDSADYGSSVVQADNGHFYVLGTTKTFGEGDYDILIMETDAQGCSLATVTYGGPGGELSYSLILTGDGYLAAAGGMWLPDNSTDVCLIYFDRTPGFAKISPAKQPLTFALLPPHPNPFNPITATRYELPAPGHVSLRVYDTAGRLVSTLVDGWKPAGAHEATFDGAGLASGIYLVRLEAGESIAMQKIVLLK